MKYSLWLACVALAGTTAAVKSNTHVYEERQGSSRAPPLPEVPSYNFTMPVDHFNPSDSRTYNNRYYINDTYYKPGGPVIFLDNGEASFDEGAAALTLAEYNGTVSATMRLAAKLDGLVIGWEHRYYGYSQPFDVDEDVGTPLTGAAAYKYLTIEQALEDLVYFANHFNTTTLAKNSKVRSSSGLDPYHTPWIFVGSSYSGARAAWTRQRNPEIFYASWASSAPVHVDADGSPYWNPISKSLPSNCTKDLQAISAYIDQVFSSGDAASIRLIKAGTFLMEPSNTQRMDVSAAYNLNSTMAVSEMLGGIVGTAFQGQGPGQSTQIFCDYLESFDVKAYIAGMQQLPTFADEFDIAYLALQNRGRAVPSSSGIVASNGQNGPRLGSAAFVSAFYSYQMYQANIYQAHRQYEVQTSSPRQNVDSDSWLWQTFAETGWYQGTKPGAQFFASKFLDDAQTVSMNKVRFGSFKSSDFPDAPNTSYPNSFGGWNMSPSNTMFTNGEFDPWRAFSVHSQESNAPQRKTTTTIPKCNTPPTGTDIFGIIYPGAVHAEDMYIPVSWHRASEEKIKPVYQGLDLFLKAYTAWQPCFNQSRDSIRNNKGVDGNGSTANGTSISSSTKTNPSSASSSSNKNAAGRLQPGTYASWSIRSMALMLTFLSSLWSFIN